MSLIRKRGAVLQAWACLALVFIAEAYFTTNIVVTLFLVIFLRHRSSPENIALWVRE